MDDDAASVHDVKMEDAGLDDGKLVDSKPGYKSWKKKYRKMRITFDQKMHDGEELHRQEQKALETSKRIAVEIDRLLDLLLDINNTAQIPTERRFDLSLDIPSDEAIPHLDIDDPKEKSYIGDKPAKSLRELLKDVPHLDYAATAERYPELVADLQPSADSPAVDASQSQHPPSFLTADDIDNYIYEVDARIAADGLRQGSPLPSLAPVAHLTNGHHANGLTNGSSSAAKDAASSNRDFMLRNPTSVYNWLRKHEPKTFLQDGETTPADRDDDTHSTHHHQTTTSSGRGRKSTGGRGGDHHESGSGRRSVGARASKRASLGRGKRHSMDESMDYLDDDLGGSGGAANSDGGGGGRGASKRKRNLDDDAGYRPKGGVSRPTKRSKRKSEGAVEEGAAATTGRRASSKPRARKSDGGAVLSASKGATPEDVGHDDGGHGVEGEPNREV